MRIAIETTDGDVNTMVVAMHTPSHERGERFVNIEAKFHSPGDLKRCLELMLQEVERLIK